MNFFQGKDLHFLLLCRFRSVVVPTTLANDPEEATVPVVCSVRFAKLPFLCRSSSRRFPAAHSSFHTTSTNQNFLATLSRVDRGGNKYRLVRFVSEKSIKLQKRIERRIVLNFHCCKELGIDSHSSITFPVALH
jgi:hypothetical protein